MSSYVLALKLKALSIAQPLLTFADKLRTSLTRFKTKEARLRGKLANKMKSKGRSRGEDGVEEVWVIRGHVFNALKSVVVEVESSLQYASI